MTEQPEERRSRRRLIAAAILALAATWPYWRDIDRLPMSADAVGWVLRSAPVTPGWIEFSLASHHFEVGYRPMAALSYAIVHPIVGFEPQAQRVMSILLHALAGFLLAALYGRLLPGLPPWGALVAAVVFLAHPVVEDVVPHLARRSYSLAAAAAQVLMPVSSPRRIGIRYPYRPPGCEVISPTALQTSFSSHHTSRS